MRRLVSQLPLLGSVIIAGLAACGAPSGSSGSDGTYGGGSNGETASNGKSADGGTSAGGSHGGSSSSGGSAGGTGSSAGAGAGDDDGGSVAAAGDDDNQSPLLITDPFHALKQGADQLAAFCARGAHDTASKALCASPNIKGFGDLQSALGLGFGNPAGANGGKGNPSFVLLGHSASLGIRGITAANPRAILMSTPGSWSPATNPAVNANGEGPPPGWNPPSSGEGWTQPAGWTPPTWNGQLNTWPPFTWTCQPHVVLAFKPVHEPVAEYGDDDDDDDDTTPCVSQPVSNPPVSNGVVLAFTRGQQIAEIASMDPSTKNLHFIAVKFDTAQTVSDKEDNVVPTPDYSAASETGWTSWTAYDDSDLADTTADCTHCHQPGGAGTQKVLRMNESDGPWTHSLSEWTPGGQALLNDFHAVHGTGEAYAGIPAKMIDKSEPTTLELTAHCTGCAAQPVIFDGQKIEDEVHASNAAQPANNATPGSSATWNALYQTGLKSHIVVPYHDVKVTDPTKLAAAATAYKSQGHADLGDLFTADAKTATLITPPASMDAATLLQVSCAECHNASTPSGLGRAKFDVTHLSTMTAEEKTRAVGRLQLSNADVRHMPPASFHDLTADQIQALVTLLQP